MAAAVESQLGPIDIWVNNAMTTVYSPMMEMADHYLAATAVEGQMTAEPESSPRPNNLWSPVPGDHGAHGRFDAMAYAYSPQVTLNKNRHALAIAALAGALTGLAALLTRGPR